MSSTNKRITDRFSAPESGLRLANFRRPGFRTIKRQISLGPVDAAAVFYKWSLEGEEQIYKKINNALLTDDYIALKKYQGIINYLREAIKQNPLKESVRVYRHLKLDPKYVQDEYQVGKMFLWPTFSSTSRDKNIALKLPGNYLFEINLSLKNGCTYCSDISKYSQYPHEKEVLIYPYSGFRVKQIFPDDRIIQLDCVDTLQVELHSKKLIPEQVKLFDEKRQIYVYLHKNTEGIHVSPADNPTQRFLIAQNQNGYWDTYYRYHHKNGYFLHRGNHLWEEYHDNKLNASFKQV
jgi:hypothetical protein